MFKQKLTGAVLAAAIALTAAGLFADGIFAAAQEQPNRAAEGNTEISLTSENSQLFLPTSYEQYLELQSPVDIAVCERYIAVAEQDTLYVYDREENHASYHTYIHTEAQISKIQFSDDGNLYFSDSLLNFYQLDFTNLASIKPTTEQSLTSLSTFYISGSTLFEVSVVNDGTTYLTAPLSAPSQKAQFTTSQYKNTPQLGFSNDKFYSVVGELVTVYSFNTAQHKYEPLESITLQSGLSGLTAATVVGNDLFYTVNNSSAGIADGLYRCDLTTKKFELLFEGDGYGALTSFGGEAVRRQGKRRDGILPRGRRREDRL